MKDKKYINLINHIKTLDSGAVAFSGGVDSTFLLRAAKDALGDTLLAVTVDAPYMPRWEIKEARNIASSLGIKQRVIHVPFLEDLKYNPSNRCYICKKHLMSLIKKEASKNGFHTVMDGTNADDVNDFRPGFKALKELQIKSPLMEKNFIKEDIRRISKELGLPTWNRGSGACLLSRIPHDTEISNNELERIEKSERFIMSLGFREVRVRSHQDIARIEVAHDERSKFFNENIMSFIATTLKEFGYRYVTLELEGYKRGSLNPKNPSV
jgi:uncharacterized protein